MMRLEVLDKQDKVIATHRITRNLTLVGTSPGAHVHLTGEGVGALHLGIKTGKTPVIMDLGGPTRLKVNGKASLESKLEEADTLIEVGERKLRLKMISDAFAPIQDQTWTPVTDGKTKTLNIRVRVYARNIPVEVTNAIGQYVLDARYGLAQPFKFVWIDGGKVMAQIPTEWINLGGRIRIGKEKLAKLSDWAHPTQLEKNVIYRVFAGFYLAEIMVSSGSVVIGKPRTELIPQEMRKPMAMMGVLVAGFLSLFAMLTAKEAPKVEEPYGVYARIQNVPVEVLPPEPADAGESQGGGGAGSQSSETTAPQTGPTRFAQAITGGLRNLVGSVLSSSKVTNTAVVAEVGSGQAATSGGGHSTNVGQLANVAGKGDITSAAKLGKLAIAGSGMGFSGGSGTGLGTGYGAGIGNGVGNGIGTSRFKVIEEETFVDGGLDKSLIAAVIQNNLSQIKYCYERQLVAEPDLFGKVVARWIINGTGAVEGANIKQTTLNSTPVEQCILTKISSWKFPQPKNGSKVTVTYPFLFKSTK